MTNTWAFIIPFSPLLYMFAIFHNKKLKNKKSPPASKILKREPQLLTESFLETLHQGKRQRWFHYICIYIYSFSNFLKAHCFIFNRLNLISKRSRSWACFPQLDYGGGLGKGFFKNPESLHFHVSHNLIVRVGLVQCSELCEGNALSIQRVILWNCTWLRKGLSLYLNLNSMENLNTGICMTENCCCLFFRMSLSWMCSNKMILKQAVDIQWFINTFCWVLRPLFFLFFTKNPLHPTFWKDLSSWGQMQWAYVWHDGSTTAITIINKNYVKHSNFVFWLPSCRICFPE